MPDYGKLSKRPLDEMIAGARVEVAPYKRDAMDFVLWKPSTPEEPGWDSPWGRGRPGWHIECSAMSGALLGETFDIHGGGVDLVFPHHENEIAQSRCAFHSPVMANYWMHNGFLMVEGEKMAKSLGNFVTIHELLETEKFGGRSWPGSVLRLAMLRTHYRQPIDWTVHALEEAQRELQTWANALINTEGMYFSLGQRGLGNYPQPEAEIVDALTDDLNAPKALAALRSIFSRLDKDRDAASVALMESCEFLGLLRAKRLFELNPYHVRHGANLLPMHLRHDLDEVQVAFANDREDRKNSLVAKLLSCGVNVMIRENGSLSYEVTEGVDVDQRVAARTAARARKDFKEADRIRDELLAMGIVLKDGKDPKTGEPVTTWEVAR
jgi:cysteinyl-tRNA synthetase